MTHQVFAAEQAETGLAAAQAAIAAGGCVVLPTDTVYGIGADAFSASAVGRLLAAKHRSREMPVPVLVGDPTELDRLAAEVPAGARALADALWPGALTLILPVQPGLAVDLGDTGGTIAVRVPDHELACELLRRTGPLAVSSANISGKPPATNCAEAIAQLGDEVAVYLDGGATPGPTPSTIIDFTASSGGIVRRAGALSLAVLRAICPSLGTE